MFDITLTDDQMGELIVLVQARLDFIAEAQEEYGYLEYADELVTLRVIQRKIAESRLKVLY